MELGDKIFDINNFIDWKIYMQDEKLYFAFTIKYKISFKARIINNSSEKIITIVEHEYEYKTKILEKIGL